VSKTRLVRRGDRPLPPGSSKVKGTRYVDIREDNELDEAQFANWVKLAAVLPGERM
jgi:hypothetical protein